LVLLILQVFVLFAFRMGCFHIMKVSSQTSVSVAVNQPAAPSSNTGKRGKPASSSCCELDAKANEIRKEMQDRIDAKVTAQQKALQDSLDAQLKQAKEDLAALENLMGKEVTLVTIYAVLAALAAGFSLVSARAEAIKKLEELESKTVAAKAEVDKLVKETKGETKDFIKEMRDEVEAKFPFLASIEENIPYILNEIRWIVNPGVRVNADPLDGEGDDKPLREDERQKVLVAEMTIAGLSVYSPEKSSAFRSQIVGIYNGLARFYWKEMERRKSDKAASFGDADYRRAEFYATMSRRLAPEQPGVSRLLGSIRAARYELLNRLIESGSAPDDVSAETQEELLKSAKADFEKAMPKPDAKQIDAGAYYNLALVHYYQNNLSEAIRLSRELLALSGKISSGHRVKYLPDAYLNLAIFLAKQAASLPAENAQGKENLYNQVRETIQAAVTDFRNDVNKNDSLQRITGGVQKELLEKGDLSSAPDDVKEAILGIANASGGQTNPPTTTQPDQS
jgi:hypothetical protein